MVYVLGPHSKGRPPALPLNARVGSKWLTATNTLAYYTAKFIAAVKSLTVQSRGQVTALCFEWQQRKLKLNHPYLIKKTHACIQNNKTFRFDVRSAAVFAVAPGFEPLNLGSREICFTGYPKRRFWLRLLHIAKSAVAVCPFGVQGVIVALEMFV